MNTNGKTFQHLKAVVFALMTSLLMACAPSKNSSDQNSNPPDVNPIGFRTLDIEDLGYSPQLYSNTICTQQHATMVNVQTQFCVEAINGCQINYVSYMGYKRDTESWCK